MGSQWGRFSLTYFVQKKKSKRTVPTDSPFISFFSHCFPALLCVGSQQIPFAIESCAEENGLSARQSRRVEAQTEAERRKT